MDMVALVALGIGWTARTRNVGAPLRGEFVPRRLRLFARCRKVDIAGAKFGT
jgi:hypothetical protein